MSSGHNNIKKCLIKGGNVQKFLEFRSLSKYLLGQLSFGAIVSVNGAKWKLMPILGQMSMGKFLWGNSRSIFQSYAGNLDGGKFQTRH